MVPFTVLIRPQSALWWASGVIRELRPGLGLWPGYRAEFESRLDGVIETAVALG